MTREEHEQILANILASANDQGTLTELLDNLRTDYTETLTNVETLNNTNTDLVGKNEKLREVNSALFLKVGNVSDIITSSKQKEEEIKEEEKSDELKFEDLVSPDGELL